MKRFYDLQLAWEPEVDNWTELSWTPTNSFLTLQLANAAGNPLKLSLSLLPAPERGDHQVAVHLLAHDQVGSVDVVHLLADALQAVLQPQHGFPQVALCHAVELVDGLALGLRHYLGVAVDVGDLLDFDLQGLAETGEKVLFIVYWECACTKGRWKIRFLRTESFFPKG